MSCPINQSALTVFRARSTMCRKRSRLTALLRPLRAPISPTLRRNPDRRTLEAKSADGTTAPFCSLSK